MDTTGVSNKRKFRIFNEDPEKLIEEELDGQPYPVIHEGELYIAIGQKSGELIYIPGCIDWLASRDISFLESLFENVADYEEDFDVAMEWLSEQPETSYGDNLVTSGMISQSGQTTTIGQNNPEPCPNVNVNANGPNDSPGSEKIKAEPEEIAMDWMAEQPEPSYRQNLVTGMIHKSEQTSTVGRNTPESNANDSVVASGPNKTPGPEKIKAEPEEPESSSLKHFEGDNVVTSGINRQSGPTTTVALNTLASGANGSVSAEEQEKSSAPEKTKAVPQEPESFDVKPFGNAGIVNNVIMADQTDLRRIEKTMLIAEAENDATGGNKIKASLAKFNQSGNGIPVSLDTPGEVLEPLDLTVKSIVNKAPQTKSTGENPSVPLQSNRPSVSDPTRSEIKYTVNLQGNKKFKKESVSTQTDSLITIENSGESSTCGGRSYLHPIDRAGPLGKRKWCAKCSESYPKATRTVIPPAPTNLPSIQENQVEKKLLCLKSPPDSPKPEKYDFSTYTDVEIEDYDDDDVEFLGYREVPRNPSH